MARLQGREASAFLCNVFVTLVLLRIYISNSLVEPSNRKTGDILILETLLVLLLLGALGGTLLTFFVWKSKSTDKAKPSEVADADDPLRKLD